jgi:hypothetical protein
MMASARRVWSAERIDGDMRILSGINNLSSRVLKLLAKMMSNVRIMLKAINYKGDL